MDAKAKVEVEAWQYRFLGSAGWSKWAFVGSLFDPSDVPEGYEVRALIPLTDHEAALAEKDVVLRKYVENVSAEMEELLARAANAEQQLTTLRSGLEALAGEWEKEAAKSIERGKALAGRGWHAEAEDCRHDAKDAKSYATILRTLASSATGEKNTEEEAVLSGGQGSRHATER